MWPSVGLWSLVKWKCWKASMSAMHASDWERLWTWQVFWPKAQEILSSSWVLDTVEEVSLGMHGLYYCYLMG